MGTIAEGFIAYAQPLLDQTDGSTDQMNKAMSLAQMCFNLAILEESSREKMIQELQSSLNMGDDEFAELRNSVINPMIRRHKQMFAFPQNSWDVREAPAPRSPRVQTDRSPWIPAEESSSREKAPAIDRYGPCPCGSGKKYKFCCGKKPR